MIVNVLIFCYLARSVTDINERVFVSGTKHFNNQWEYGGYTTYDKAKNRFELVPGDQYSEGYIWFSNRLPRNNWSFKTVFEFSLDSNLNHFGVWITSRFGPTGEVFGGPTSFVGVAILFKFAMGKLEIEVRQSNGTEKYNPIIFIPAFQTKLTHPKVSLNVSFSSSETLIILLKLHQLNFKKSDTHQKVLKENLNIELNNQKSDEFLIFNDKPIVSLSHFWMGVTSYNPKDGKPLYLKSVQIEGLKSKFSSISNTSTTKNPKTLASLLNSTHSDQNLVEKVEKIQESETLVNFDNLLNCQDVIKCIESLVNASNQMLRQKLLIHVAQEKTTQFAESWQRRSLTATNDLKFLRNIVQNEMSLIEQEISSLSYSVWDTFKKFQRELIEITDELMSSYEHESKIKIKELKVIDGINIQSLLLYITIFEIIIIFIFIVFISIRTTKSRNA